MDRSLARGLAEQWIDAWNRRDLGGIVAHYAEDVQFYSPTVERRWNIPDGRLVGKEQLREHFRRGLEAYPLMRFDLVEVLVSPGGYAVVYRRETGGLVVDAVECDDAGLGRVVRAYYSEVPPR